MYLFWFLRKLTKSTWLRLGLGRFITVIESCDRCGARVHLIWTAPNDLWEHLTGYETPDGDNAPGVYCPRCFDWLARQKDYGLLRWVPEHVDNWRKRTENSRCES